MKRISVEEAQQKLLKIARLTGKENVELMNGLGRVLAEDVIATMSQPPFMRSAMDGYAICAKDSKGASQKNPVRLCVIDKICAGDMPGKALRAGEAVRIMTGGMIPEGADCVIRQEDTDYGEDVAELYAEGVVWQNCCPVGEDFLEGEVLGETGNVADAYMLAAAAASGIQTLCVRKRVRVAIITTGEELVPLGEKLSAGKIYNSNVVYLSGRLLQMGCEVTDTFSVGDDVKSIFKTVEECAKRADVILTTGGVSVGQKDLLPPVMKALGAEILFHGIDIKPGMPTMASVFQGIPVLSLSGNPYSSAAVFELLMQPLNARMTGSTVRVLPRRKAVLAKDHPGNRGCRRMLRGYYDGEKVIISKSQHNAQMKGGIGSNCYVDVPAGAKAMKAEDVVNIIFVTA